MTPKIMHTSHDDEPLPISVMCDVHEFALAVQFLKNFACGAISYIEL